MPDFTEFLPGQIRPGNGISEKNLDKSWGCANTWDEIFSYSPHANVVNPNPQEEKIHENT
jgi:hypothetical protein